VSSPKLESKRGRSRPRPLFSSAFRFISLVAVAVGWVTMVIHGSSEYFGSEPTYAELMIGGRISTEIDVGLSGDYLGFGDLADERGGTGSYLDFEEVADLLEEMINIWHAILGKGSMYSLLESYLPHLGGLGNATSLLAVLESEWADGGLDGSLGGWDSSLLGADFEPALFSTFFSSPAEWLLDLTDRGGSSPHLPPDLPAPSELLSKAAKQVAQVAKREARAKARRQAKLDREARARDRAEAQLRRHWERPWTWLRPGAGPGAGKQSLGKQSLGKLVSPAGGLNGSGCEPAEAAAEAAASELASVGGASEARKAEVLGLLRAQLAERFPDLEGDARATGFGLDDDALGRYLEVTHWELEAGRDVAAMVAETVSWRLENSVHKMADLSGAGLAEVPSMDALIEAAHARQVHVNGFDKEGHAVVIYTPTVDSACPIEHSVMFLVYNLERALALGAAGAGPGGQRVRQYSFIVDLSATGTMPPLKTVKASFAVMGRHYPMRVSNIMLVNGGSMIQWIWRVLEPLVDPRTREKVKIVSEQDEARILGALIDRDQLERRFEGGLNAYNFDPDTYLDTGKTSPSAAPTRTSSSLSSSSAAADPRSQAAPFSLLEAATANPQANPRQETTLLGTEVSRS